MGNSPLRDYDRLIEITVLGKTFHVPENNTCLRAFQYLSPENISYGRFCWNQDCQQCRMTVTVASQPDVPAREFLACKVIVAEGMQITGMSEELRHCLMGSGLPPGPRPPYDE
jgi:NADH dehydrogenase/NADH:ubiquinone oxidoreductase subunit G